MACMQDMQEDSDNSVHLDRIRSLENTVEGLNAEIVDIKVAFADKTLTNIRKASTPTYADSVRGSGFLLPRGFLAGTFLIASLLFCSAWVWASRLLSL